MKKTALVVATALMVTMVSSMAFAGTDRDAEQAYNQTMREIRAGQIAKYLTKDQITKLDKLETNYLDSVSDLVKETAKMRIELDQLKNNTNNPDPETVQALEKALWEKTGKLTEAKKAFTDKAKSINPAFPYAVNVF